MNGHQRVTVCGFVIDAAAPRCGAPATGHIMASLSGDQLVRLVACGQHGPAAHLAGNVVMCHRFTEACEQAGAHWDFVGNRCVVENPAKSAPGGVVVAVSA